MQHRQFNQHKPKNPIKSIDSLIVQNVFAKMVFFIDVVGGGGLERNKSLDKQYTKARCPESFQCKEI